MIIKILKIFIERGQVATDITINNKEQCLIQITYGRSYINQCIDVFGGFED